MRSFDGIRTLIGYKYDFLFSINEWMRTDYWNIEIYLLIIWRLYSHCVPLFASVFLLSFLSSSDFSTKYLTTRATGALRMGRQQGWIRACLYTHNPKDFSHGFQFSIGFRKSKGTACLGINFPTKIPRVAILKMAQFGLQKVVRGSP